MNQICQSFYYAVKTIILPFLILVLRNATGHEVHPHDDDDERGCDFLDQSWCLDIPKINLPQYLIAPTFIIASFFVNILLCQTIFSKVLGPWPQVCMCVLYKVLKSYNPLAEYSRPSVICPLFIRNLN